MIRLTSPAHAVVDPPTEDLVLGLILGGSAGAVWSWDGARANATRARRPGTLGLTPIAASGTFEVDGHSAILIVSLPYRALAKRLAPDLNVPKDFGALHDAYQDHPAARSLCRRMWRAAGRPGFGTDLAIDALSESLLACLSGAQASEPAPGLSLHERQRVERYAAQEGADVPNLADALAMPIRTFRRRFQTAYGVSPHRWLASRRIDRARALLHAGDLSISEAALELGFASQAHFTDAFRRATGTTPARFRREVRA